MILFNLRMTLAFATLISFIYPAHAEFNYPGGVAEVLIKKQNSDLPDVRYGIREPVVIEQRKYWRVLVGISLQTLPGEYLVHIKHNIEGSVALSQTFNIQQKYYPILDDKADINETLILHSKLSNLEFSNTEQPSLPLRFPLAGNWENKFGHVLSDNSDDQTLHQQNLIFLNVDRISVVVAPQNGIVSNIETDDQSISTVFLDHGRGLYSVIRGVADLTIEIGNGVVAGAVLGKTPDNNQVNRLSWQCILNGVYVNPIILTQL